MINILEPQANEAIFNRLCDGLAEEGFAVVSNVFPAEHLSKLRQRIDNQKQEGAFKDAGIGKLDRHNIDKRIRGDKILWLEEDESGAVEKFQNWTQDLMHHLNRELFLSLKDVEMHFAVYPPGSFYKRHSDQFNLKQHRRISMVFYLNDEWKPEYGGNLRIYRDGETDIDILPEGGKLVLFRSELEHEVLPTNAPRYSLTGWFLDIEKQLTFL